MPAKEFISARELILLVSQVVWLIVSILLMVHLKVFARRSLGDAPVRRSNFSLLTVGGVVLLYVGLLATTQVALSFFYHGMEPRAAATQPLVQQIVHPEVPLQPATQAHEAATQRIVTTTTASQPTMGPAPATENLHEEIILQTADAFTKALPACLILLLCTRLVVGGLDGWGLSLRKIPKGVVAGVLGLLVIYPSLIVLNIIVSTGIEYFAHRSEEIHPTLQLLTQPNQALWERIGFIIVAGAVAPVLEEIFFRGLLQTTFMERSWGLLPQENMQGMYRPTPRHRWAAILVTSFIFAAIHLMPDSFLVLFALAVGLGYVYERTGNLWASITLHAAFNCLNMYLFAHAG